jgi:hypothetical protein
VEHKQALVLPALEVAHFEEHAFLLARLAAVLEEHKQVLVSLAQGVVHFEEHAFLLVKDVNELAAMLENTKVYLQAFLA